jgi:flavorubredoxin
MARVDEIVSGIYRISTTMGSGEAAFQFNQFLIDDERPALVHTGLHQLYEEVHAAVAQVLDPTRLAYIVLLHFEADECGGMDRFLEGAPNAVLACSALSADINLAGWSYRGRVEGHRDGEVVELGRHRLRFLETPHVHHWDSMMLFDEATRSVFPSDLFIQPGDQPPVIREDSGARCVATTRRSASSPMRSRCVRSSTGSSASNPNGSTGCTAEASGARRSRTTCVHCGSSRSHTEASC